MRPVWIFNPAHQMYSNYVIRFYFHYIVPLPCNAWVSPIDGIEKAKSICFSSYGFSIYLLPTWTPCSILGQLWKVKKFAYAWLVAGECLIGYILNVTRMYHLHCPKLAYIIPESFYLLFSNVSKSQKVLYYIVSLYQGNRKSCGCRPWIVCNVM